MATSTINTSFCLPSGVSLLPLERMRSVAPTFRITQIPIAEYAAPSAHITRGFVLWRLSDAGHRAYGTVFTAGIRNPAQNAKNST